MLHDLSHYIPSVAQVVLQNIYNSALFNAELFSDLNYGTKETMGEYSWSPNKPSIKKQVGEAFIQSQKEVAAHYVSILNDGFLKNYYASYTPKTGAI